MPSGRALRSSKQAKAVVQVVEPGALTLIEDLGRPGHAAIGVSESGALDRGSLRLANRLVGNAEGAAGLEVMLGGLVLRAVDPIWCAVTGAWGSVVVDSEGDLAELASNRATLLHRDSLVSFGMAERGLRYYVAFRGGLDAPALLGSRSSDQLSGLGPEPISAGARLGIRVEGAGPIPAIDFVPVEPPTSGTVTISARPGPRQDWFSDAAVDNFYSTEWAVATDSNRVGVRLERASPSPDARGLERVVTRELPSEAMIAGAVQVPPSGLPTVLLADHPVTGGYPVIAVVTDASLDLFAQVRPGQRVRFTHSG